MPDSSVPADAVAASPASAVPPADGIGEIFGEFARRGLMFLGGPHAVALALPAVKGR